VVGASLTLAQVRPAVVLADLHPAGLLAGCPTVVGAVSTKPPPPLVA